MFEIVPAVDVQGGRAVRLFEGDPDRETVYFERPLDAARHWVSLGAATLRFFAAILSWLPLGLGFFWQLWDADRLTWHDRLSRTRIVHYPRR